MNFFDLNDDIKSIITKISMMYCIFVLHVLRSIFFLKKSFKRKVGSTCSSFNFFSSTCKFEKESKVRRNWRYDGFYELTYFNYVNIELIENFSCDNANSLICEKNEVMIK